MAVNHFFPLDGEYVIKIRLKRSYNGARILGIDELHQLDLRLDGERIKLFKIGGTYQGQRGPAYQVDPAREEYLRTADAGLEVRLPMKAGTRLIGGTFGKETTVPEGALRPRLAGFETEDALALGSVTITGPYDVKGPGETASRRKIFVCRPSGSQDEEPCAREASSSRWFAWTVASV